MRDPDYFRITADAARQAAAAPRRPLPWRQTIASVGTQLQAASLKELIAFTALTAQRLLQNGTVDEVQLLSLLALADSAHSWFRDSGYSSFARASARQKAELLIDRELSGLDLVHRSDDALTEAEERS